MCGAPPRPYSLPWCTSRTPTLTTTMTRVSSGIACNYICLRHASKRTCPSAGHLLIKCTRSLRRCKSPRRTTSSAPRFHQRDPIVRAALSQEGHFHGREGHCHTRHDYKSRAPPA
eukprot:8743493-Pyramimonas_sp.AAC.1